MHSRSSRNTGEAKRTKGYFLSIFPYFSQFILYIIISILHFAWYSYRYLWAFLHLQLRVGYGAGTGVGHSKFTHGWPMLITPAEECGCTRCAHCFFLSFCPLIRELQGQGGQPLLVIHIWDHFEPTERENPLCCILLGDFEQTRRGLSFSLSMLGLVWTNRRGNPSCCVLLGYWEGETLLVIRTYLGRFEPMERVSPPCWVFGGILNREGETLLVVRVSNQLDVFCWAISVCPLSISFFFPANYNLRAKPWLYKGAGFAMGFHLWLWVWVLAGAGTGDT